MRKMRPGPAAKKENWEQKNEKWIFKKVKGHGWISLATAYSEFVLLVHELRLPCRILQWKIGLWPRSCSWLGPWTRLIVMAEDYILISRVACRMALGEYKGTCENRSVRRHTTCNNNKKKLSVRSAHHT